MNMEVDKKNKLELESNGGIGTTISNNIQSTTAIVENGLNGQINNKNTSIDVEIYKKNLDMGKSNSLDGGALEHDDETQEPMLKNDTKIPKIVTPKKDMVEATDLKKNGETKINMNIPDRKLCGLTKEELMKYVDDPFWIRLRWFLFVAFWFVWIAMLAGAVAIIVMAPKCYPPEPKKWWEKNPIVELSLSSSDNLKEWTGLLPNLTVQGVKVIALKTIYKQKATGQVINFTDIDPTFGTMRDFKQFIQEAKNHDQMIILDMDPNHSSSEHPWFKNSIDKIEPYSSYYLWHPGKKSSDGKPVPPNNWLDSNKKPAWTYNDKRGEFYYHQFDESQPDFNFREQGVVIEFKNILSNWLDLGVSGFRMANIRYLTEDSELQDEKIHSAHGSLIHARTKDQPDSKPILQQLRDLVLNKTEGYGLFMARDELPDDVLEVYNERSKGRLIDLPQRIGYSGRFMSPNVSAGELNETVSAWINGSEWPALDLITNNSLTLRSQDRGQYNSLTLLSLFLPLTPIFKYTDNATFRDLPLNVLTKTRDNPSFTFGGTKTFVLNNGTVFAYTRFKSSNPGILVAYNTANQNAEVDFSVLPYVPKEIELIFQSEKNDKQNETGTGNRVSSEKIVILPKRTAIFKFVAKHEADS